MRKLFVIYDSNDNIVVIKRVWSYTSLGDAKTNGKAHINRCNLRRPKDKKLHYEDMNIKEYELIQKDIHKL